MTVVISKQTVNKWAFLIAVAVDKGRAEKCAFPSPFVCTSRYYLFGLFAWKMLGGGMQILVLFVVELFVEFAFVCVVTYYLDPPVC